MDTKSIMHPGGVHYQPTERSGETEAGKANRASSKAAVERPTTDHAKSLSASGVDVAVSGKARDLAEAHQKAFEIAKASPDVREERVAELRKQIQEGTYKPRADQIADGMLREAILDQLSKTQD